VQARVVPVGDVGEAFVQSWQHLAARSEPNPFFEPSVVLPAARHLAGGSDVAFLVVQRGDDMSFLAPIRRLRRYRRAPVPTVAAWVHDYCFLGTPLVAGDVADVVEQALARCADDGRWVALPTVALDGEFAAGLARRRPVSLSQWERPVVRRRDVDDYLQGRISGRHLKNLRRLQRKLSQHLGEELRLVDTAAGDDLDHGVDELLRIEATGWKGRAGTAMAARPADAAFFREMCRELAGTGQLELWLWGPPRRAVAALCTLKSGGTVFHFKIAYDDELRSYSPGSYLDVSMVGTFHADTRLSALDSCAAPGPSMSDQLYPDRRRLGDVIVPVGGRVAAAAATASRSAAALWRARPRRPVAKGR
jgi:CelD/BcsL family acetyltransferase involved in cellulose biosynthesis